MTIKLIPFRRLSDGQLIYPLRQAASWLFALSPEYWRRKVWKLLNSKNLHMYSLKLGNFGYLQFLKRFIIKFENGKREAKKVFLDEMSAFGKEIKEGILLNLLSWKDNTMDLIYELKKYR